MPFKEPRRKREVLKDKQVSEEFLLPWSFERHDLINYLQMAMGHIGLVNKDLAKEVRRINEQLKIAQGYLIQQKTRHKPLDVDTEEPYHPTLHVDVEKSKLLAETKSITKGIKKVMQKLEKFPKNEHITKGKTFLENALRILEVQRARLAGREIPLRESDVKKVIEKVVSKHKETIDFDLNFDPEVVLPVHDIYFERALDNLLINSKRAFEEWKEKRAEKPKITIKTSKRNSDVVLQISDNGPGFSKEILEKDPFKIGVTSKSKGAGGGTGLAIVKHIIESHGGTIEIINKGPGNGAHFKISFKKMGK